MKQKREPTPDRIPIGVRVSPEMFRQISTLAEKERKSRNYVINDIFDLYFSLHPLNEE